MEEAWANNVVALCGVLAGAPKYSHKSKTEEYFVFPLAIERLSGTIDTVNVVVRREIMEALELRPGRRLQVGGELRSYNNKSAVGNKLVITVFTKELDISDEPYQNQVHLRGTVCKPTVLRKTPTGREICDIMLAVNRKYGRSDYLPCIAWGDNAITASELEVGSVIELSGRIQSRNYIKVRDNISEEKTAYEVSVTEISTVNL